MTKTKFDEPFDQIVADAIAREVCDEFKVTLKNIRSDVRLEAIAVPRHAIMALTPGPDGEVAEYWNKERTTRRWARQAFQNRMDTDSSFRQRIEKIKIRVGMSERQLIPNAQKEK